MKARLHETINQIATQQISGRIQAQMRSRKQFGGTGEESHGLVGHQKRFPAGERNASRPGRVPQPNRPAGDAMGKAARTSRQNPPDWD